MAVPRAERGQFACHRLEHRVCGSFGSSQAVKRFQPLRDDVLVRREHVVGQGFPVREQQRVGVVAEEAQFLLQHLGVGRIGRQYDRQAPMLRLRFGDGKPAAAAVESPPGYSRLIGGCQQRANAGSRHASELERLAGGADFFAAGGDRSQTVLPQNLDIRRGSDIRQPGATARQ